MDPNNIENSMVAGDVAGDWERFDGWEPLYEDDDMMLLPQPAPFEVGDRVEYRGDAPHGYRAENGETVWHLATGERGTVVNILPGFPHDETTPKGESIHDASVVQMDLDPTGKCPLAVDVDGLDRWALVSETND